MVLKLSILAAKQDMNFATTVLQGIITCKTKSRAIAIIIKYLICVINKELQVNYN
jgi:hypothetical protein